MEGRLAPGVLAAGGAVLRTGPARQTEILLVHRPGHRDWTLPKGKVEPGEAEDPMLVFNVTDEVRETIQSTLYSLLMQRQSVFR